MLWPSPKGVSQNQKLEQKELTMQLVNQTFQHARIADPMYSLIECAPTAVSIKIG
jgi:hypothetical protein